MFYVYQADLPPFADASEILQVHRTAARPSFIEEIANEIQSLEDIREEILDDLFNPHMKQKLEAFLPEISSGKKMIELLRENEDAAGIVKDKRLIK